METANQQQKTSVQQQKVSGMDSEKLSKVAESLRLILADTFVLYMKTYAVHWNYQGQKFFSVHKLTEEHYEQLAEAIDEIAERIRALGKVAPISLQTVLASSDLAEMSKSNVTDDQTLVELIASHRLLAQRAHEAADIAEEVGDLFSQDMMIGRIGEHDKAAWMLQSFLNRADLQ